MSPEWCMYQILVSVFASQGWKDVIFVCQDARCGKFFNLFVCQDRRHGSFDCLS